MSATDPGNHRLVEEARAWALSPEGRTRIGLDGPHPMTACMEFYRTRMGRKYIGGWCSDLVLAATGKRPNQGDHNNDD